MQKSSFCLQSKHLLTSFPASAAPGDSKPSSISESWRPECPSVPGHSSCDFLLPMRLDEKTKVVLFHLVISK